MEGIDNRVGLSEIDEPARAGRAGLKMRLRLIRFYPCPVKVDCRDNMIIVTPWNEKCEEARVEALR